LRGGNGHSVQKLAGSDGVADGGGSLGVVGFGGEPTTTGGLSGVVGVTGFEIGTNGDTGTVPGGMYPVIGLPPPGPLTGTNGTLPVVGPQLTGYPFPGKTPPGLDPGALMHPGISKITDRMNIPALVDGNAACRTSMEFSLHIGA